MANKLNKTQMYEFLDHKRDERIKVITKQENAHQAQVQKQFVEDNKQVLIELAQLQSEMDPLLRALVIYQERVGIHVLFDDESSMAKYEVLPVIGQFWDRFRPATSSKEELLDVSNYKSYSVTDDTMAALAEEKRKVKREYNQIHNTIKQLTPTQGFNVLLEIGFDKDEMMKYAGVNQAPNQLAKLDVDKSILGI